MRIFLDANILFSAAKTDGAVRRLLQLLLGRGHECHVDEYVVTEARRNLAIKGPAALAYLDSLLAQLRTSPIQAANATPVDLLWLPEKDRPVLAAAIVLRCDALVTGDQTHFGKAYGKTFGGVTVYSPRQLAEVLF